MENSDILQYEQQLHSPHSQNNAKDVLKWMVCALLFLISAAALVVATLAYNKQFALSAEDQAILDNIKSKISFSGDILLAEGFSDEAGFLATNGNIQCNNINVVDSFSLTSTSSFVVDANLHVGQNLQIDGYENSQSDQISTGVSFASNRLISVVVPSGCGGTNISQFNANLSKVIFSGLVGTDTAASTVNGGATWLQLTTPFANPGIEYSPILNVYTGIDISGTAVYTSISATNGSWVVGTAFSSTFGDNTPIYVGFYQRFYTNTTDVNYRIASSTNGSTYAVQSSNRDFLGLDFIPSLNRIVTVGPDGPQYSDNGLNWTNSSSSVAMSSVCFSGFWKKLFALPRNGDKTLIYYSVDGIDWQSTFVGFDPIVNLRAISWSDQYQIFIASGDSSQFWVSRDGFRWNQIFFNFSVTTYGSRFYNEWGNFISCGINSSTAITPQIFIP
jgi:hypothetical protein